MRSLGCLVLVAACDAAAGAPTEVTAVVETPPVVAPVASVAPVAAEKITLPATFDFRIVQLDPTAIGTTGRCDVRSIDKGGDPSPTAPLIVTCMGHGHHYSRIAVTLAHEARSAVKARTQIEVRIDGEPDPGTGVEARTTFVGITGELPPPPPPSRCLCDRDRDRARRAERAKPPTGFDFTKYDRDREKYWGTRQTCVIDRVSEIARSSPDARPYGIGRVFDPEQLPYAAKVWCGGDDVTIGARGARQILNLAAGQAIEVELGWASSSGATAKLIRTSYWPERRDD
jgi:hypothetical protein